MSRPYLILLFIAGYSLYGFTARTSPGLLEDPYRSEIVVSVRDTVPPIKPRYNNFLQSNPNNPFDLKDPDFIRKDVQFDPVTGKYLVTEKIGDEDYRPPSFMSFDEYLQLSQKQQETQYFRQLAGISTEGGANSALDPIAKFDVQKSLVDRLFGGSTVDIRPQGNIDLTFGADFQRVENPILTERQRRQGGFDFDMNIQMNVTGKIGEKLNMGVNYNTNATFDFDNQIKLNYNSDLFSEDEILKRIDAGNVSLPLRGTLIQGAQSLFGVITELQFGHLRITAVASQQKSQRENIQIKGGGQIQEYEVKADEYDENRHFFLTFYNRGNFEPSMQNLPQVRSLFHVEELEVWVTNNRNEVTEVRDVVALADLSEPSELVNPDAAEPFPNPVYPDLFGSPLPDNNANGLYAELISNPAIREIDQVVSILQNQFQMQQARDFEKVSARKLSPSEYTYHPDLGYVSLNINVQPDQVVGAAFTYSYNGKSYKVGELSQNSQTTQPDSSLTVLFVKMLKSTTQRTDVPTWDLMMKNIYSLGAFQVNKDDFKFDIQYEDPGRGDKRFLPESNLAGQPLLEVFNLDNLNVQGDPQPDGVFDFVPGITINPRNGRVMYPVLEPFGSSLAAQIDDQVYRDKYVYQELYDLTKFQAQEYAEKNLFVMKGSYKSAVSDEISLGAYNIPPGSVRVTAGGQMLKEGIDYEIDYNVGRVRILNDAILNSGVGINVSFEDNTLFGFQLKSMMGLRADYEIDENFHIGATYMHLYERPFTQKVNIGNDPINNRIYGFDLNMSRDAPWLTRAVDALPFISTKEASNISVSAEAAFLSPGHSKAINQNSKDKGGVVYIDDFEGAASSFDLRQPTNQWFLASIPQNDELNGNPLFPESALINDNRAGSNRARLNWYRIDQTARTAQDQQNPYTSTVPQVEVFPNLQLPRDALPNVQTFDLTYYPGERGPYNFDTPNGHPGFSNGVTFSGDSLLLRDPETRWGGIMRSLSVNDFQTANIEFLEFWMLSPFLDSNDASLPADDYEQKEGELYINLGNISEDILRDSRKFFENGLPGPANPTRRVDTTDWSVIPIAQQITQAFDNDQETRILQDVGLDGLDNDAERQQFGGYLNAIAQANPVAAERMAKDPAWDDFRYYLDGTFDQNAGVLERYRDFNNPHGNSAPNDGASRITSGTNIPDAEDLNRDNTLNETEAYFQYRIPLRANPMDPREIDNLNTPYITDRREDPSSNRVWYRFRVPLNDETKQAIGGIRDFRSIRFIRMYLRGFEDPVTLRFARFELVRNTWRQYTQDITPDVGNCEGSEPEFSTDVVNIEKNSGKLPFNYVLPVGIQREQTFGVFNTLQNEQSISLITSGLCDGKDEGLFKNINMDWRVYDRFKMFVHAEEKDQDINDGELSVFVRVGTDFKNNYYEYEVPVIMSDGDLLPADNSDPAYSEEVWRIENEFDFPLELFTRLKELRNEEGFSVGDEFLEVLNPDDPQLSHRVKVKGNPNLGLVKVAMIGVRNRQGGDNQTMDTEVWVNEMRLTGLDERGGMAALARVDMQMADFGALTLAGNFSSIGFGALDQKVQDRQRDELSGFDLAANFELGKFFPNRWGLRLPFYTQFSKQLSSPEYDPYDLDITLKDKLRGADSAEERDSIRTQAQDVASLKSFTFTNVGKTRMNNNPAKPWDIENFSASYSYTESELRDPIIEFDNEKRQTASVDYTYSKSPNYLQPFQNLSSSPYLQLLTEFNFNPLPNSFSFGTLMDRRLATTRYRFTGLSEEFSTFYNKSFIWDRRYDLQWDFTRSLKFLFNAVNNGVIDEPNERDITTDPTINDPEKYRRDSIWSNIRDFGRTKNYQHNFQVSYTLPMRYIPFLDWVQVRGQYQAEYGWSAAALNTDSLGNVIRNRQDRQFSADLNFEGLYNKIGYLQRINRGPAPANRRQSPGGQPSTQGSSGSSAIEQLLIRPLMLLRRARFNWQEQFATALPGYMPGTSILGMSQGFESPGWGFVAGWQPKIRTLELADYYTDVDWLNTVGNQEGWISSNVFLNKPVVQEYSQRIDGQITIEPFADFILELEANRNYVENHTQFFKDTSALDGQAQLVHTIPRNYGSMTVSYSALNTLFENSRDDIISLFKEFENNRVIISERLGDGTPHEDPILAGEGYEFGYGPTQQDVLIPAFIAAYTDQDPEEVSLDIFDMIPRLNWRLTYNGLTRIPLFQGIFQNFSLSHGYRSTFTVNSYDTGLDWLRTIDGPEGPLNNLNDNFYPRTEIPQIAITEAFSPLVALDATLTNGLSLGIDYNKARNLQMSFVSNQLAETRTEELVLAFGLLLREINLFGGGGGGGAAPDGGFLGGMNNSGGQPRPGRLQGNDLDIQFNFSMRDDVTYNHLLDQDIVEPTRGNFSLSILPSAEYQVSSNLSLRLFYEYRRNVPKTSAGFPRTDTAGGVVVRFQLN